MTPGTDAARARRYLLGEASDEESAVIEQEYLMREEATDRISEAEDDLIEDYLENQLDPAERERFERAYLSVPHRRVRVETVRRLMAQAAESAPARPEKVARFPLKRVTIRRGPWLALAASLLLVTSIVLWMFPPSGSGEAEVAESLAPEAPAPSTPDPTASAPANTPRVFALTVSPVTVRSAADNPSVVIPAGTDVVAIRLDADADARQLTATRALIRTVNGNDVWQGPVTTESNPPPGTAARLDVPAASLPPDDYVVTLFGSDQTGVEHERSQYFLRVKVP